MRAIGFHSFVRIQSVPDRIHFGQSVLISLFEAIGGKGCVMRTVHPAQFTGVEELCIIVVERCCGRRCEVRNYSAILLIPS